MCFTQRLWSLDGEVFTHFTRHTRNPYPTHIVWKQCNDVVKPTFYWLSVNGEHCRTNTLLEAFKRDQTIEIKSNDLTQVEINLNENFFNFDQKLTVHFNGQLVFDDYVSKDTDLVGTTFEKQWDPFMFFCSKIVVNFKGEQIEGFNKKSIHISNASNRDKTHLSKDKKKKYCCFF